MLNFSSRIGTKLNLNIFIIICTILCQGIGTLSEEDINKSSNLHVRRRRLINLGGHAPVTFRDVSYIVHIQIGRNNNFCGGSILAPQVILTAAHCVAKSNTKYSVISASSNRNNGTYHKVLRKIIYPEFRPTITENDLAMLIISPPIDFTKSPNRAINLYNGFTIPINSSATLSGWGCTELVGDRRVFHPELKSMNVHTISQEECQKIYGAKQKITNKEFCTFDNMKQKGSCFGDSGGPLAINGQLAGVLSWSKTFAKPIFPDVYTNLAYVLFRKWILFNLNKYEYYRPGCFAFPKFCSIKKWK